MSTATQSDGQLLETARRVLPGGGFGNVSHEVIVARGLAGHVWDVDGKEYIDYLLGSGPMIVGHAHPEVVEVDPAAGDPGHHLLRQQRARHPSRRRDRRCRSLRRAGALRLHRLGGRPLRHAARPRLQGPRQDPEVRGRLPRHERLRAHEPGAQAAGNFPQPIPDSAGIPKSLRSEMLIAPFNDLESVASLVREHKARPRRHHRRAVPAPDPAQARLPRGPAQDHARRTIWS